MLTCAVLVLPKGTLRSLLCLVLLIPGYGLESELIVFQIGMGWGWLKQLQIFLGNPWRNPAAERALDDRRIKKAKMAAVWK